MEGLVDITHPINQHGPLLGLWCHVALSFRSSRHVGGLIACIDNDRPELL